MEVRERTQTTPGESKPGIVNSDKIMENKCKAKTNNYLLCLIVNKKRKRSKTITGEWKPGIVNSNKRMENKRNTKTNDYLL